MQVTERVVQAKETAIPALGLGTWQATGQECVEIVSAALAEGYRHIDTAQAYENEAEVGKGIRSSGIDRDEIFLTTKVWIENFEPQRLKASVEESLKKLRTGYVNLLLLHWPNFEEFDMQPTLEALVREKSEGRALAIGVSNFTLSLLERAQQFAGGLLCTNQVEYHPFLDQERMLATLREKSMALTAYSPLARGAVFKDPVITEIADRHGVGQAQVAIAWLLNQDRVVAIPKTSSLEHAKTNLAAAGLVLTKEEMLRIDKLRSREGRIIDPHFAPDWD